MKQHAMKLQDRVEIHIAPVFITGTATATTTLCMRTVDRRTSDILEINKTGSTYNVIFRATTVVVEKQ